MQLVALEASLVDIAVVKNKLSLAMALTIGPVAIESSLPSSALERAKAISIVV
jgi:hypothetical protein